MSVLKGVGDHCSFLPVGLNHNTAVAKKCNFIMEMQSNLLHVGGGNLSLDFLDCFSKAPALLSNRNLN